MKGAKARAGEGAVGRWKEGSQWAGGEGEGRSWSGPGAFCTALAGGRGGGLEPKALGRPQ